MSGERETATESLLVEQLARPVAGLFLDRHQIAVFTADPIPVDGDQVTALCGAALILGPPPAEVLPGIPATQVADCADCQAVLWTPPEGVNLGAEQVPRILLRRTGAVPVHIVEIGAATAAPTPLVALCGAVFGMEEPVYRVNAGDGVPCTLCLLRSLSDHARHCHRGRAPCTTPRARPALRHDAPGALQAKRACPHPAS
ncbi:hypothetical protein [Actinoalloteichus hymeniacidonis]|uniref:Uncharacterized protein n=1 Tax=Actinoalloteichus hymeniacidonis TaxID=340345 RepID=A0AAC9HTQ2_9PSEU|nr:hypothetical protein [Actinoalloteichus hymeniacidonis]AOS65273.1 hypothetical protein TL08_22455 [Actinoalloteichus hymeniacidonis]MBB5906645.1 hypothetical protein [Actinoalloteichus hymeniacidonis]